MKLYNPQISIIVPVYNTEKYLEKCFDSLCKQTLKDIEIIIIDDGSTDSSKKICDEYGKSDSRFRVLHKKHGGLSSARNYGLDIAKGKYIMFVDSDDYVSPAFCEAPFNEAEKNNADIVVFQFIKQYRYGCKMQDSFPIEGIVNKEKVLTDLWRIAWAAAWNKLYRRELFNEIRYPLNENYEDIATTHRLIYNASIVYVFNRYLYHYRTHRTGSITTESSIQRVSDFYKNNFKRIDDLKNWGYPYRKDEIEIALAYISTFGRKARFSSRCVDALEECNASISICAPIKHKILFRIYRFSPVMFEIVSMCAGKRKKLVT